MRILLKIPPFLLAIAFLAQLSVLSVQASHTLSPLMQETTPRPTLPKPTSAATQAPPPGNSGRNPTKVATPFPTNTPKPGPTATPTVTPTVTKTMDLSLNAFLTKTLSEGNPTNTPTPFVEQAPTQNAIIATLAVTHTTSMGTLAPSSGTGGTVTKGVLIPFVISVIFLLGIFGIREFLRKRF